MSDSEVELMMRTLAQNVQSYEQVVEVCSLSPYHQRYRLYLTLRLK